MRISIFGTRGQRGAVHWRNARHANIHHANIRHAKLGKIYVRPVHMKVRNVNFMYVTSILHTSTLRMSMRHNITSCISYFCYKGRRNVHALERNVMTFLILLQMACHTIVVWKQIENLNLTATVCLHVPTAHHNAHIYIYIYIYMQVVLTSAYCAELPSQTRLQGKFLPIE